MSEIDNKVYIDVSARHIHLRPEDIDTLFGDGYQLTPRNKDFHLKGEEVYEERLAIVGPRGMIENVTILGPLRKYVQVEVSATDARKLGIAAEVRLSGDHEGTPGCTLIGAAGELVIDKGVIIAKRHVHMGGPTADALGINNGDLMTVKVTGTGRDLIFGEVVAEVYAKADFPATMHIDTDEANAAGIRPGTIGLINEV